MPKLNRFTENLWNLDTVHLFDDFFWLVTAHMWTTLAADTTPTVTCPDVVNGVARLFTDTTDNNEVAVRSTIEPFKFGTDREIYAKIRLQYTEGDAGNKANVFAGFASAIGANLLVDNGGGPRVTGDICGIYKVDGGSVWKCVTQTNGTAQVSTSTKTAGGSANQELEVKVMDIPGAVTQDVTFFVDGVPLYDSTTGYPIRHAAVIASATEMNVGVYAKTGGAAGGETVDVDYIYAAQRRV